MSRSKSSFGKTYRKRMFQTLKESSILKVTEIEEMERRKDSEANNRIEQLLEDLRNHHENKMLGYKQEKENYYQQKLQELNQANTDRDKELVQGRKTINDLQFDNNKMLQEVTHLNEMVNDIHYLHFTPIMYTTYIAII